MILWCNQEVELIERSSEPSICQLISRVRNSMKTTADKGVIPIGLRAAAEVLRIR